MSSIGDELEMSTAAGGRWLGGAFEEERRRNGWRLMRRRSRCRLDHKYEATRQSSMPACEPAGLDPQPIKRHQHHPFPIPFPH